MNFYLSVKKIKLTILAVFTLLVLFSCEALKTAPYDQYSYQKSIDIKIDSSRLMDEATTSYSSHSEEIDKLLIDMEKMVEYEKNKPNNEITYAMWKLISDENKNLLGGFFKRWEEKETLSQAFVIEAKSQVMEAMDMLIQYEGKKDKDAMSKLLQIINNQ
ncbi:hypothetical protein [Abyssalbus ytuae]|uniref:Uncharacterized protein n=1 Tax=Abyssalbus ytuae TaxID=2926907 RepID=A0A9E6ZQT4_9FLAO|nr:hypothetical protein [Abyssalbus ytuae]UOB17088.1 hypothetical protein MQE35_15275 [Abyssalbus ytuae]